MEKKRRARINKCLNDLKSFLLDSLKRDSTHTSKMEKADILELTVQLLRSLQRQQLTAAATADSSVLERYQSGWAECASQVFNYTGAVDCLNPRVKSRLVEHLDRCYQNINAARHQVAFASSARNPPKTNGAINVRATEAKLVNELVQQTLMKQSAMYSIVNYEKANSNGKPLLTENVQLISCLEKSVLPLNGSQRSDNSSSPCKLKDNSNKSSNESQSKATRDNNHNAFHDLIETTGKNDPIQSGTGVWRPW